MNPTLDKELTFRILKGINTPFTKMDAYKEGIIDKDGKVLKKMYQLKTSKERNAYTHLDRLIITFKKLVDAAKKRGDYSLVKSLTPALWLVRENLESGSKRIGDVETIYNEMLEFDIILSEEEIAVKKFLEEEGGAAGVGGAPANNVGGGAIAAVSRETGGPAIHQKDIKKFRNMARRSMPGLKQFMDKNKKIKEVN